jgi:hypothetical protein
MDWMLPIKSYNPVKEEGFLIKSKKTFPWRGRFFLLKNESGYLNWGRFPSFIAAAKYLSGSFFHRRSALEDQK